MLMKTLKTVHFSDNAVRLSYQVGNIYITTFPFANALILTPNEN